MKLLIVLLILANGLFAFGQTANEDHPFDEVMRELHYNYDIISDATWSMALYEPIGVPPEEMTPGITIMFFDYENTGRIALKITYGTREINASIWAYGGDRVAWNYAQTVDVLEVGKFYAYTSLPFGPQVRIRTNFE